MLPFTDFLAYKEGSYHRTPESFKFNGYHLIKLIGWSKAMDGSTEWIAENSWGADWGSDGYVRILGGRGDVGIDSYALGMSAMPYTVYEYMSMQNMKSAVDDYNSDYDSNSYTVTGEQDEDPIQVDSVQYGDGTEIPMGDMGFDEEASEL